MRKRIRTETPLAFLFVTFLSGLAPDTSVAVNALDLLEEAAQSGARESQYRLGNKYFEGSGVSKDKGKASKWWLKAAQQGHSKAQEILGQMYFTGNGVQQDYVKAYAWLLLSASWGNKGAETTRGALQEKMTQEQLSDARQEVQELLKSKEKIASQCFRRHFNPSSSHEIQALALCHLVSEDEPYTHWQMLYKGKPRSDLSWLLESVRDAEHNTKIRPNTETEREIVGCWSLELDDRAFEYTYQMSEDGSFIGYLRTGEEKGRWKHTRNGKYILSPGLENQYFVVKDHKLLSYDELGFIRSFVKRRCPGSEKGEKKPAKIDTDLKRKTNGKRKSPGGYYRCIEGYRIEGALNEKTQKLCTETFLR